MSAIAGVFYFDGAGPAIEQVKRMTTHMQARGPDGISHWSGPGIALGYCQLCTTPESLHEKQPLMNESGTAVLVFAGRVDNWQDLRSELLSSDSILRDDTDAELVLKAWEVWQEDSPDRIIGDFVYFIWDVQARRLFGARDVAGNRALYYTSGNGWFAFASETRALIASGLVAPAFNEFSILDYISVENDRIDQFASIYRDICKLPLGHAICMEKGRLTVTRYWHPEKLSPLVFSSQSECEKSFREILFEATRCRLRSTSKVGACLSGGIDSSSVAGLACKIYSKKGSEYLHAYSLVQADRSKCADWPYIRRMQKTPNLISNIISSDFSDQQCQMLLDELPAMATPYELSDRLTDRLIAEQASSDGCRVLLDGMAGDMLFLTPEHSLEYVFRHHMYRHLPDVIFAHYRHGISGLWTSIFKKTLRFALPAQVMSKYRKSLDKLRMQDALKKNGKFQYLPQALAPAYIERTNALIEYWEKLRSNNPLIPAEQLWLLSPMVSFAYESKEAMMGRKHIEQRGPFSDRRVMEFAFRMPMEAKLSLCWFKHTLRGSMSGILPPEVRQRHAVGGHPGWKFMERLAEYCIINAPAIWQGTLNSKTYSHLINAERVRENFGNFSINHDPANKIDMLSLAVIFYWMHTDKSALDP